MIIASVKTTTYCNIDCDHCFIPKAIRELKNKLSVETLHQIIDTVIQAAQAQRTREIAWIWIGGEPLRFSAQYYQQLGHILDQRLRGNGFALAETIQTSLIPLRKEHLSLFQTRFASKVGSSIDFSQRHIKGDINAYHTLWMEKVMLARNAGVTIFPVLKPTKTEVNQMQSIYHWLLARNFTSLLLSSYQEQGSHIPPEDVPTNAEQSEMMIDFFMITMKRLENDQPVIYCNTIANDIYRALAPLPQQLTKQGCQRSMFVFDPNGRVGTCPSGQYTQQPIGNVRDGATALVYSPKRQSRIRYQQTQLNNNADCLQCEFLPQCKRGCLVLPKHSEKDDCSGYRHFLRHVVAYSQLSSLHYDRAINYARIAIKQTKHHFRNVDNPIGESTQHAAL